MISTNHRNHYDQYQSPESLRPVKINKIVIISKSRRNHLPSNNQRKYTWQWPEVHMTVARSTHDTLLTVTGITSCPTGKACDQRTSVFGVWQESRVTKGLVWLECDRKGVWPKDQCGWTVTGKACDQRTSVAGLWQETDTSYRYTAAPDGSQVRTSWPPRYGCLCEFLLLNVHGGEKAY